MNESTSALDPHSEEWVLQTLEEIRGTRTIVLVSHRLLAASICDEVLVMQRGRVVERAPHDQLLGRGRLYAQMVRIQMSEDLETRKQARIGSR